MAHHARSSGRWAGPSPATLRAWDGYLALRHAQREGAASSRARCDQLSIERQQLLAERAEAERLRKLLGFARGLAASGSYVGGRVIGVRLGAGGLQVLTIDRGADDGVDEMMPVVVADGVVGRVHAVAAHTADVLVRHRPEQLDRGRASSAPARARTCAASASPTRASSTTRSGPRT